MHRSQPANALCAKSFPCERLLRIFISTACLLLPAVSGQAGPTTPPCVPGKITLCWNAPEQGCDHYRVEITRTPVNSNAGEITVHYTRDTGLEIPVNPGFEYRARIQSSDAFGVRSDYSEETGFSVDMLTAAETNSLPQRYSLSHSRPNPFNPSTAISFALPRSGRVQLCVYNISGQKVATLTDALMEAGTHSFVWNATGFSSGTYFCTLTADGFRATRKMVLVK